MLMTRQYLNEQNLNEPTLTRTNIKYEQNFKHKHDIKRHY